MFFRKPPQVPVALETLVFTNSTPAGSLRAESRTQPLPSFLLVARGAINADREVADGVMSRTCRSLSIDQDLSRERKLCPKSGDPEEGTTDAMTSRSSK